MEKQPATVVLLEKYELSEKLGQSLKEILTIFQSTSPPLQELAREAGVAICNLNDSVRSQRPELVSGLEFTNTLESFLHKMNGSCEETEEIQESLQEAVVAIKKLKNIIDRKREDHVVGLVKEGLLAHAREKLKVYYGPSVKLSDLEKILTQASIGRDGVLKNVIEFVDHLKDFGKALQLAACFAIYEEMCRTNRSSEVEILLLQDKINQLGEDDAMTREIKLKIARDVEKLIENIVSDIKEKQDELVSCGDDVPMVLNDVIPSEMDKYLACEKADPKLLWKYAEKFLNLQNCSFFFSVAFKHMQQRDLLKTEAALHLWALAQSVLTKMSATENADPTYQKFVSEANDELSKNEKLYFKMLKDATDKFELSKVIDDLQSMVSVLGPFVKFYYAGNTKNVKVLIDAKNVVSRYEIDGRIRKSLFEEMERCNHLGSFEAFRFFFDAHKMTSTVGYNLYVTRNCSAIADLEYVKGKIPKCLTKFFECGTKRCRIFNKCYNEPLCVSANGIFKQGGELLPLYDFYLEVSSTNFMDQFWSIAMDKDTCIISFKQPLSYGRHSFKITKNWMVKAVDDDYFKLIKITDEVLHEYLTANPSLYRSDDMKRTVQWTYENHTTRQLWRLEFD